MTLKIVTAKEMLVPQTPARAASARARGIRACARHPRVCAASAPARGIRAHQA